MKRLLAAVLLLLCPGLAYALPPNVRAAIFYKAPSGAAPAYQGPGDFLTYNAAYGQRALSAATRGNKQYNVCNSTGGVDVGCADLFSDAVTGNLVPATISGITCPGANCTVKIRYDLTGNGLDASEATSTIANRDTLNAAGNCSGLISASLPCSVSRGGRYVTTGNLAFATPMFITSVVMSISGTNEQDILADNGELVDLYYRGGNQVRLSQDQTATFISNTAAQGAIHSVGGLVNGVSTSFINVDGSVVTGTLGTHSIGTTLLNMGGSGFGATAVTGSIFLEAGAGLSAPTSATMTSEMAAAKTYWGYP